MRKIIGNIIKANKIFKMIENGDKICVGVSGGKDSTALLYCLNLYKKIAARDNINFEVIGVHLKLNLCAIDFDVISNYWNSLEIDFYIHDSYIGDILKNKMKKDKIQCSLCSKMKKAILIDAAKKYNCNKIAMGHHADDAIETMFLNLINEGRLATFKPKMYLDRSQIWFIRPLITCRERDISNEVTKLQAPVIPCGCPMEGFTQRDNMKHFLSEYFYQNKKWSMAYKNFYIALMNGKQTDLWFIDENDHIIRNDLRNIGNK